MSGPLTLVLDQRQAVVKLEDRTLRVQIPGRELQRIPLNLLGMVIVHGSPMISCDVWRALAAQNIPALLFPGRGHGSVAHLGGGLTSTVENRVKQHRAALNREAKLATIQWILQRKLKASRVLLTHLGGETNPGVPPWAGDCRHELFFQKVQQARTNIDAALMALGQARSADPLMGIEGRAAAAWFKFLAAVLLESWSFFERNRRPPKDPVNALLSLAYTLLGAEMARAVQTRGLDPGVGFLHATLNGRESLVLDFMEPLRPGVDAFVLSLLEETLTPEDFAASSKDGCRLRKDGRTHFYQAWAAWRLDWPILGWMPKEEGSPAEQGEDPEPRPLAQFCRAIVGELLHLWQNHASEPVVGSLHGTIIGSCASAQNPQ